MFDLRNLRMVVAHNLHIVVAAPRQTDMEAAVPRIVAAATAVAVPTVAAVVIRVAHHTAAVVAHRTAAAHTEAVAEIHAADRLQHLKNRNYEKMVFSSGYIRIVGSGSAGTKYIGNTPQQGYYPRILHTLALAA